MRWQLLLLLGLAAVSLAYDSEVSDSDSEEFLDDLMDDNGKIRSSKALELLQRNGFGREGWHIKSLFPLVAAKGVGTLAKITLLVLIATGTIPSPITDTTDPEPAAGTDNAATSVLANFQDILTGTHTETAIAEIWADTSVPTSASTIAGELFLAQSTTGIVGSGKTLITGTLMALTAGETYHIDVATRGIFSGDCTGAGDLHSENSGGTFTADGGGRALLLVEVEDSPLTGDNTVLGRSIVITTEADQTAILACGTIVRG